MPRTDGRLRPSPLPDAPTVLALDLGGTRTRAAAIAPDGSVSDRVEIATPLSDGPHGLVAACAALLEEVRDGLGPGRAQALEAVGISAPGPLDPMRGILIEPPNLGGRDFHHLAVAEPISAALRLPAFLERDTHVAALAEAAFGAARGLSDFIYITVSTGLGGGVVIGGRLLVGPGGVAGEIGHLTVSIDGPPCGCGYLGHVEGVSSGSAIARAGAEAAERGDSPALAEVARRIAPASLEALHVSEAADRGDAAAVEIMDRARRAFAALVVGLVNVFNPQRIIVGGGVAGGQGERLLGPARDAVSRFAFRVPAARVEIVLAELGDDVGLCGAIPLIESRRPQSASVEPASAVRTGRGGGGTASATLVATS